MTRDTRHVGGLAAGGTGVPVAAAAVISHSTAGIIIAAAAAVLSTAIVVVVPEWFRLQALRQPGRDLRQLIQHTSVQDARRLWPELQSSYPKVLGTRGATAEPGPASAVTAPGQGRQNDRSGYDGTEIGGGAGDSVAEALLRLHRAPALAPGNDQAAFDDEPPF